MDISKKIEAIEKKLMMLQNSVNLHIGSYGEDIHALADDNNAGFLAPDLAKILRQRKRSRTWVNDSDIMVLEAGYYTGVGFLNAPMTNITWQCDVDIYYGYEGRKNIYFYENVANQIYHTTVTSDTLSNTFDWQIIQTNGLLYSDNSLTPSNEGKILTLIGQTDNYNYLEVWVHNTLNNIPFVFKMNRTLGSGSQTHFYVSEPTKGEFSELVLEVTSTQSVKVINNTMNRFDSTTILNTEKNVLSVTKIVGVKGY